MKKYQNIFKFVFCAIFAGSIVSWIASSYNLIWFIAETHLTQDSKDAVVALRPLTPKFKDADLQNWLSKQKTHDWHSIKLPPNLSFAAFLDSIEHYPTPNIYSVLIDQRHVLAGGGDLQEKATALTLLPYLLAEIHQPLNRVTLRQKTYFEFSKYDSQWHQNIDRYLLKKYNGNVTAAVNFINKAYPFIKGNSGDSDIASWLYDSYTGSNRQSKENKKRNNIYATAQHFKVGYHLAILLNECFAGGLQKTISSIPDVVVKDFDYSKYLKENVGKEIEIEGKINNYEIQDNYALLAFGSAKEREYLTIVLKDTLKNQAPGFNHKAVSVKGTVLFIDNKPQIKIDDLKNICVIK